MKFSFSSSTSNTLREHFHLLIHTLNHFFTSITSFMCNKSHLIWVIFLFLPKKFHFEPPQKSLYIFFSSIISCWFWEGDYKETQKRRIGRGKNGNTKNQKRVENRGLNSTNRLINLDEIIILKKFLQQQQRSSATNVECFDCLMFRQCFMLQCWMFHVAMLKMHNFSYIKRLRRWLNINSHRLKSDIL